MNCLFKFKGNLIEEDINIKVDFTTENLKTIYKIIQNNPHLANPNNFSKSCGTTGLFAFIIKDLLEHFGLLNDKKNSNKTYFILKEIINTIKTKSNHLNNLLNGNDLFL